MTGKISSQDFKTHVIMFLYPRAKKLLKKNSQGEVPKLQFNSKGVNFFSSVDSLPPLCFKDVNRNVQSARKAVLHRAAEERK